ncbi:unnamed protein product, partial [Vitis vinifera]
MPRAQPKQIPARLFPDSLKKKEGKVQNATKCPTPNCSVACSVRPSKSKFTLSSKLYGSKTLLSNPTIAATTPTVKSVNYHNLLNPPFSPSTSL